MKRLASVWPLAQKGIACGLMLAVGNGCVVRDASTPETFVETTVATLTGDLEATFTFESDEPLATFLCAVDELAFAACTSPFTTATLSDGEHTFKVKAVDVAGNEDPSPATHAWVVDSNLPRLEIVGPPALTTIRATLLTITASKPVESFVCAVGDAALAPCVAISSTSAQYEFEATPDGAFALRVEADDAVGYTATATYAWVVDATEPVLTAPTAPAAVNNLSSISITFASNEPLADATCSYDGGAAAACTALTYSRSNVPEGQHSLVLNVHDLAGNAASKTVAWRTDKTKPVLAVEPLNGKWSVTSNESTHVVATGLNATIAANQVKSWGTLPTGVGNHSITVTGTDTAGNVQTAIGYHCVDNPSGTICD
ncbi:MAG: hypothetical protein IPL79_12585 [Myxococcales bacterium]|nr:hypothetical protein [Myxococcales bacterium]